MAGNDNYEIWKTKRNFLIVGVIFLIGLSIWGVMNAIGDEDNLTLSNIRIVTEESGNRYVNGLLTNNVNRSYTGLEISFSLLDNTGQILETGKATTDFIPGEKTWEFNVPFQNAKVTDVKINSISTVEEVININ